MIEDTLERNPGLSASEARGSFVIRRIGVIGAGQMGNGIAHVAALSGYEVSLNDVSRDRYDAAIEAIAGNLNRQVSKGDRPGRFIGMHFMNPVPLMKLVEIIRGLATDRATYEMAIAFARSIDKTTTNSEDYPAFIVNRILVPMINEAVYALYEGVGTVEAIDTAMKLGANHPMGPLTLADFIGLDTCLSIMQVLHDGLADTKYRPCPLLVKYVEAGWVGRKAGRGFYDYSGDAPVPTRDSRAAQDAYRVSPRALLVPALRPRPASR